MEKIKYPTKQDYDLIVYTMRHFRFKSNSPVSPYFVSSTYRLLENVFPGTYIYIVIYSEKSHCKTMQHQSITDCSSNFTYYLGKKANR